MSLTIRASRNPVISDRFAEELSDKGMRDAYLQSQTRSKIASQIRALRNQRGLSQKEFGARIGTMTQGNVARLESRNYGNLTIRTLLEIAKALDIALSVEFVDYGDFIARTQSLSDKTLGVESFSPKQIRGLLGASRANTPSPVQDSSSKSEGASLLASDVLAAENYSSMLSLRQDRWQNSLLAPVQYIQEPEQVPNGFSNLARDGSVDLARPIAMLAA